MHGSNRSKAIWSIWYNHAVVPLYVVLGTATFAMTWFLTRYFTSNVEISFNKEMRMEFDSTGMDDDRASRHTNRLMYPGIMQANKKFITMFPFSFEPMHSIRGRHQVQYAPDEECVE